MELNPSVAEQSNNHKFSPSNICTTIVPTALVLLAYWQTISYLVKEWSQWEYGEYAHGFVVLGVVVFMLWSERKRIIYIEKTPSSPGIGLVLFFSICWAIGVLLGIRIIESLSLFLLIPATVYALAGRQLLAAVIYPTVYVLVALPVWDPLLPVLQSLAADLSFLLLKIMGVTVLKEGTYLSIPYGQFLITEGCSGLRYLLAAMTFGGFYIFLENLTYWRAAVFFCLVVSAAILANGLRITAVVVAGEMTQMQHPWVHEHLSLGWYIFAAMLFPVFWFGIRLSRIQQDQDKLLEKNSATEAKNRNQYTGSISPPVPMLILLFAALVTGPAIKKYVQSRSNSIPYGAISSPDGINGWQKISGPENDIIPFYKGADAVIDQNYRLGRHNIRLYLASYYSQRQDKELINVNNVLFNGELWKPVSNHRVRLDPESGSKNRFELWEIQLRNTNGEEYLIWTWYDVSGFSTTSSIMTKFYDLLGLFKTLSRSSVIMMSTKNEQGLQISREQLEQFLRTMYGPIIQKLNSPLETTTQRTE